MNKKIQRDISHPSQENIAVKITIKFLLLYGTHRHYDIYEINYIFINIYSSYFLFKNIIYVL